MNHTNTAIKIAITLPQQVFKRLESLRKKDKKSRSGVILQSISHWLEWQERKDKISAYEKGYEKYPEGTKEWPILETIQAETMEKEEWS